MLVQSLHRTCAQFIAWSINNSDHQHGYGSTSTINTNYSTNNHNKTWSNTSLSQQAMDELYGQLVIHRCGLLRIHTSVLHCIPLLILWLPSWSGFHRSSMCIQSYGEQIPSIGRDEEEVGVIHQLHRYVLSSSSYPHRPLLIVLSSFVFSPSPLVHFILVHLLTMLNNNRNIVGAICTHEASECGQACNRFPLLS